MKSPDFAHILQCVTVPSHDDGQRFTDLTRLHAIESLLDGSDYQLLSEGPLYRFYGKRPVNNQEIIIISTHIDCVYQQCYCEEQEDYFKGTFDNSLTNALVIYNMLSGLFPSNVYIAFTGDEEKNSGGCHGLIDYLSTTLCGVRFALVTDVSNAGWEDHADFSLENDQGVDLYAAYRVVNSLDDYCYTFLHDAEPDESWDYAEAGIPTMTLCLPVKGDMHSDAGVLVRKSSLPVYSRVLQILPLEIIG